jgi:DNA-binding LytR/AlgR family response regulator
MTMSSRVSPPAGILSAAVAAGFAYWLAFDLALEPGNIRQAIRAGTSISWGQEAMRIAGAGVLGGAAAPLLLWLVRRFPMEGPAKWRHTAFHTAMSPVLSVLLIASSCPLAALLLASERRPLLTALRGQLAANMPLVTFSMLGFVAIAHVAERALAKAVPPVRWLREIPVRTRSGTLFLQIAQVDWIETQGNYLALHVGTQTHLVRASAKRLESSLDPERFVRIHRQTIVALDLVRGLSPLNSGDAIIRLVTGQELRVSRGYRERLQARLQVRLGTLTTTT